jgi:hypothetical protein
LVEDAQCPILRRGAELTNGELPSAPHLVTIHAMTLAIAQTPLPRPNAWFPAPQAQMEGAIVHRLSALPWSQERCPEIRVPPAELVSIAAPRTAWFGV